MKKTIVATVVAGVALLGVARPATAMPNGAVTVKVINTTTSGQFPGRATVTGAINTSCQDGPPVVTFGPAGSFHVDDRLVCREGELLVSADGTGTVQVDPTTCVGRFPQGGTFQFTGGTGEFAGATGGGTWTGNALLVFRRTAEGCLLNQQPLVVVLRVTLTGTIAT
ncbi:MAG: hypothetical protein M3179_06700 [Actinomycetota bacterium]|nr:hypothetical protein [Actinomycetota bacterium]